GVPNDVGPSITSSGHNLIQAPDPGFGSQPSDILGKDPLLGPLQNNGGPTPTRALLAGSPAIGAGDPALAGTTDQRGSPRPLLPDIGAYQTEPATQFAIQVPNAAQAGVAFQAQVLALDAQGNVATTYSGTVHFTSTDGQATLPADSTLTNGVGSFPVTFRTAGQQTLTATDAADGSITGSATASVSPAAATH